jgi:hypothetical protein
MQNKLEQFIRRVYRRWKVRQPAAGAVHPDEETLACFLEGRLTLPERDKVKLHLIACDVCAEAVALQAGLGLGEAKEVPTEVLERLKTALPPEEQVNVWEVVLKLKEKVLEVLSTTGDVLVGQELVPAPVLRSRKIKEFKDEVTILKDFASIRLEAKIENKHGESFSVTIMAKERETSRILKDLRITLFKGDVELESYVADSGSVIFDNVLLGKYTIEVSNIDRKLASLLLDVRA